MAYQPNDPNRPGLSEEDMRRQARLDNELKADPEIAEGTASGAKVAMFALAIAVVLGAVFYGLNNSTVNQADTSPAASTAQNTTQSSPPAAPPGMRDVTPKANTEPGVTTGAAPARPQVPPPAGTQIDRPANPPASAPAAK
jgi:uncharacterized protein HemX